MKNGLLIWNVLLTVVCGYLLFNQFSSKKKDSVAIKPASVKETPGSDHSFRIAYFEMDSVENNYLMVKQVKAEINKREEEINMELERLDRAYKTTVNGYQSQAHTMTQAQSEEATQEVMKLQEKMKSTKQSMDQDYNDFVTRRKKEVTTRIEEFLKDYNRDKAYTYIIVYEPGLFYYKDSAYNITADVIKKGLNELYNKKG